MSEATGIFVSAFDLVAAAVAGVLVTLALQENLTYLHTPTEVRTGTAPKDARFRLGGVVCEGSVHRRDGTLEVDFAVTDRVRGVPVSHTGILPDMFKEGTSVIATGRMRDGVFVADEVLAKHDETYVPREVAQAMAASAGKPHTTDCGAD
ncbi:MAG: cytochrome c maturation protein CcmE [Arenimonas sp.]